MKFHRPFVLLSFLGVLGISFVACSPLLKSQPSAGQVSSTPSAMPQWQIDAGGKMAFDAVSVKLSKSSEGGHGNLAQPGGHISIVNVELLGLVAQAYKFTNLTDATDLIFGIPGWARSKRFDIEGEAPGNPTLDQKRLMLQSLLTDRFHLVAHRENRKLPVYAAVLAKPGRLGPQLLPHRDDAECNTTSAGGSGSRPSPGNATPSSSPSQTAAETAVALLQQFPCGRVEGGLLASNDHDRIWTGGRKLDMSTIADSIGEMEAADRPVVDRTGLSGLFDFTVEWSHQLQSLSANPTPDVPGMMSLPDALREQLGLKLEPTSGFVDVLVIDHVDEPSPN